MAGHLIADAFEIHQEVEFSASCEGVFDALLNVQAWWSHHFKARPVRLVLEPRLGGEFRQEWGDGEGALFGVVTLLKRPEVIRLSGPLGMGGAIASVYEWRLEPCGNERTRLSLHHAVSGLMSPEDRESHDRGWRELWEHLARFVERGEHIR